MAEALLKNIARLIDADNASAAGIDPVLTVLAELGPPSRSVRVRLPDDLPELYVDAALLERILANLLGNALRHSPADRPPLLSGSTFGEDGPLISNLVAVRKK